MRQELEKLNSRFFSTDICIAMICFPLLNIERHILPIKEVIEIIHKTVN